MWTEKRRPELLDLFAKYVYGRPPVGRPAGMTWEVVAEDRHGLRGNAITKTVRLYFSGNKEGPSMELGLMLPNTGRPAPVFAIAGNARSTGFLLERGFGFVSCRVDQIQIDGPNGYASGIRGYFAERGQKEPGAEEWGAISAWAWGLSRAMDYLQTDRDVDPRRIMLEGFSRLGKVAMWAGAQDTRFAITFATDAGPGGATIVRRAAGLTLAELANGPFSYWFDRRLRDYTARENESLPVDWHELVALFAPRPVYIATASEDESNDPEGSFLAAEGAEPVYRLFGETGVGASAMPPVNSPVGDFVGFHMRAGEHGLTRYDWEQFVRFAERHFGIAAKQRRMP